MHDGFKPTDPLANLSQGLMRPKRTPSPEGLVTLGLRVPFVRLMIVNMTAGIEARPHVKTLAHGDGSRLVSNFT